MKEKCRVGLALATALLVIAFAAQALAAAPDGLLKQGMSGRAVYDLQLKLQEYGYLSGEADGQFGSATRQAVIDFQQDCGLNADGVVGPATLEVLRQFQSATVASRGQSVTRMGPQIVAFARRFIGVPYVWSGHSPSGFDCSGFVYYIYEHFGVELPRMADSQYDVGFQIGRADLQPGDLVFFSTYEPGPSHVGMYLGGGQFIHASSAAGEVTITPLTKPYYQARYLGARRLVR